MSAIDLVKQPLRSRTLRGVVADNWSLACAHLGLEFNRVARTASGTMGGHQVAMTIVGSGSDVSTEYQVALDTPHAPQFSIVQSLAGWMPSIALADLDFGEAVTIDTNDDGRLDRYLTRERRQDILEAFERWPNATITNETATAAVPGVASDSNEIIESLVRMAVLAESLSPCWTEVALDEGAVLSHLFQPDRSDEQVEERFSRLYKGAEVSWTGEVVQVGDDQAARQLAMVMLGSAVKAKAGAMWHGRVVAMTRFDTELDVRKGDVVRVSGALRHLDGNRRMFRIDDFASWKPGPRVLS